MVMGDIYYKNICSFKPRLLLLARKKKSLNFLKYLSLVMLWGNLLREMWSGSFACAPFPPQLSLEAITPEAGKKKGNSMVWAQVYYCKCSRKDSVTMATNAWLSSGKFSAYVIDKIVASWFFLVQDISFINLKYSDHPY